MSIGITEETFYFGTQLTKENLIELRTAPGTPLGFLYTDTSASNPYSPHSRPPN